jgi:hypothetical protein
MRSAVLALVILAASAAPAMATGDNTAAPEQAPASRQERLTSAESFMPMPTLSAGVLQRNASLGTIVVDMGLDVPDAALRRRARTAPDPAMLTRLLQQSVDRVLGAQGARVLLVNIIYQRHGR